MKKMSLNQITGSFFLKSLSLTIVFFTFILNTAFSQSQQGYNFTLTGTMTGSHDYTARDFVKLTPSFKYTATSGNSFKAKADAFILFPPENGSLTGGPVAGDNGLVGSIPGQAGASSMGGATYSIPLDLPPGIGSMVPSLGFVYNSMAGNGVMGMGWNITGLSSISRTGKTVIHDGFFDGVYYTTFDGLKNDDLFGKSPISFDGQRLINVAITDSTIEYKTEIDNYAKIIAYINQTNGIQRFKVWQRDGLIVSYGNSADSRIEIPGSTTVAHHWLITRVEDRLGNYYTYEYQENNSTGEVYISKLSYTGNSRQNLAPFYEVVFNYDDSRPDKMMMQKSSILKRLSFVEIKYKPTNTLAFRYDVSYSYVDGYSAVKDIKLSDPDSHLNPSRFEYFEGSTQAVVDLGNSFIQHNNDDYIVFGDFNGDGYIDYVTQKKYGTSGNNFFYYEGKKYGFKDAIPHQMTVELNKKTTWHYTADINGDGKTDIIEVKAEESVLGSSGKSMESPNLNEEYSGKEKPEYKFGYKLYITALLYDDNLQAGVFKKKDLTPSEPLFSQTQPIGSLDFFTIGDFNKNGIEDGIIIKIKDYYDSYKLTYIEIDHATVTIKKEENIQVNIDSWGLGSFSGIFKPEGTHSLLVIDSVSKVLTPIFEDNELSCSIEILPGLTRKHRVFTGNFNVDGITDLLTYDTLATKWEVWKSDYTDSLVYIKTEVTNIPLIDPSLYHNSYDFLNQDQAMIIRLADFTNDGLSDILHITSSYDDNCVFESEMVLLTPKLVNNDSFEFIENSFSGYIIPDWYTNPTVSGDLFYSKNSLYFITDLNNDGFVDIFSKKQDFSCYLEDEYGSMHYFEPRPNRLFSFRQNDNKRLLKSVSDGLGGKTQYTYGTLSDFPYEQIAPSNFRTRSFRAPIKVVTSISTPGQGVFSYNYKNAIINTEGKGLLGFQHYKTASSDNFSETISEINSDNYLLLPVSTKSNHVTTTRSFQISVHPVYQSIKRIQVESEISKKQDQEYFIGSSILKYFYDEFGNDTLRQSYHDDRDLNIDQFSQFKHKTQTRTSYLTPGDNWLNSLVLSTENRVSMDGSLDIVSKKTFTYYDSQSNKFPLLKELIDIPNNNASDSLLIKKTFDYDAFGNIISEITSAPNYPGLQNRSTTYQYAANNHYRFPTKVTNTLGHFSTTEYNNLYGYITKETNANNKVTTIVRNTFGTEQIVTGHDGNKTQTLVRWNTGIDSYGTYHIWTQTSGSPEEIRFLDYNNTAELIRTKWYNSQTLAQEKNFNDFGQLEYTYLPYFEPYNGNMGDHYYQKYIYDSFGRLVTIEHPHTSNNNTVPLTTETISYQGNLLVKTNRLQQTTQELSNSLGWLLKTIDHNGEEVTYEYYADGKLKKAMVNNIPSTAVSIEYNSRRERSKLTDPNYGVSRFYYDAFGQIVKSITPKGVTTYKYDALGRVIEETNLEGSITTEYYNTQGKLGMVKSIISPNHALFFTYDNQGRVISQTESIDADYTTSYTYDLYGRLLTKTDPFGVSIQNVYDDNGYLIQIKDPVNNKVLWNTEVVDPMGVITQFSTGDGYQTVKTLKKFTAFISETQTQHNSHYPIINNYSYKWDHIGNLIEKACTLDFNPQWQTYEVYRENYSFDNLNRLTTISFNSLGAHNILSTTQYDDQGLGNIVKKTQNNKVVFDNAVYGEALNAGPHAITQMDASNNGIPDFPYQKIEYNSFDKLTLIKEGPNATSIKHQLNITYGIHKQRITQSYENYVTGYSKNKIYTGNCEIITENDTTRVISYISGPMGVFAANVRYHNGANHLYFIHKDYLGTWSHITTEDGELVQELNFDVWGNRRDPSTWAPFTTTAPVAFFDRGFTGHEHLYEFGLINMNGRVYDPVVSRFLSPDPYIQSPDFSQSFNRYSYCWNNPLIYSDPSGELILGLLRGVIDAIASGGLEFWNWGEQYTKDAWSKADPTMPGTAGNNSYRMWKGYLNTEDFFGQFKQNTIGFLVGQSLNTFLDVDYVDNNYGANVISSKYIKGGAFTMGTFIMGPSGMRADYRDHLFVHEYGHVLQSKELGWAYLYLIAIPSLASYKWDERNETRLHNYRWFEVDANKRAVDYFSSLHDSSFDKFSFITGSLSSYENPRTGRPNGAINAENYWKSANPVQAKFHWSDFLVNLPGVNYFLIF